jgi:7-carboxy-7-deazaguanine synthase
VNNPKYHVAEHMLTFQGEGIHQGRTAYFIRLMGCDQQCHFCDSAQTWHKEFKPLNVRSYTASQLGHIVSKNAPQGAIVVVTGGEPTLYDLRPLCNELHRRGFNIHLETAGHHMAPMCFDWITLSPKPFAEKPLGKMVQMADEFKIIVEDAQSIVDGLACIEQRHFSSTVWLNPEWSQAKNPAVLNLITETVKANPNLRVGFQTHKMFGADLLDPNSDKRVIPLGGRRCG